PREILTIIGWFLVAAILPVIIIAGIVGGIMTPSEAGAIGVIYALIIGLFVTKELTFKSILDALNQTVLITAIVMIMVSIGNVMIWWLTIEGYPAMLGSLFQNITENPYVFLLLLLILLLFVGLFIDQTPAMIMLAPIFAPLAVSYGIDPIHIGMVTVMALAIGLVTPPVGLCLFVTSSIANVSILNVFRASIPYYIVITTVLILITFFPQLYLWVPTMFGL